MSTETLILALMCTVYVLGVVTGVVIASMKCTICRKEFTRTIDDLTKKKPLFRRLEA